MAASKRTPWHSGQELAKMVGEGRQKYEEAAQLLGVSANTVYRWVRSPALPNRVARKVADTYGVSEQWLSSGLGPRYTESELAEAALERRLERIIIIHTRNYERDLRRLMGRAVKIATGMEVLEGGDED
jgi:transposase-like protein